jgi:hypothetical protein
MPLRSGERPEGKVPVETPGCSADFSRLEASHWRSCITKEPRPGRALPRSIADGTRNRSSSWLFRGQRRLLTNPRAHSLHCHLAAATSREVACSVEEQQQPSVSAATFARMNPHTWRAGGRGACRSGAGGGWRSCVEGFEATSSYAASARLSERPVPDSYRCSDSDSDEAQIWG